MKVFVLVEILSLTLPSANLFCFSILASGASAFTSSSHRQLSIPLLRPIIANNPLLFVSQSTVQQQQQQKKKRSQKSMCALLSSQVMEKPESQRQRLKPKKEISSKSRKEEVPKTLPEAFGVFFFSPGPFLASAALIYLFVWRIVSLGPIDQIDISVVLGCVVFWAFQEHWLHGKVLHSEFDWYGKAIHQEHHAKPYHHVSIDPAPLMLAWLGTAHLIFRWILPLPLAVSATLGYASAGLFYEWAHFIVHTKVKPQSNFMKKMRDNHIKHHNLDDRYWLAFSIPAIDDWLCTNPSVKDVRQEKKQRRDRNKHGTEQNTGQY